MYLDTRLLENNLMRCFRWPILCDNEKFRSKHYYFKNWFLSNYLENAMKSAINWIVISNEIMQWKKNQQSRQNKFLHNSFKVSRSLDFLIFPCRSPSFDVCFIFILQVILLYFTPPQHTHEWKSLLSKKISGVYGGTYSEPTSRIHGYFIIVALKRISFPLSIKLNLCLSQDS